VNHQDKPIEDGHIFFNAKAGEGLFKLRALSFTMSERQEPSYYQHIINIKNKYT
jgi:hypothetical protein